MWQEQGSYQVTPPCRESTAPRPEAGRQIETKAQTGQVGVGQTRPGLGAPISMSGRCFLACAWYERSR